MVTGLLSASLRPGVRRQARRPTSGSSKWLAGAEGGQGGRAGHWPVSGGGRRDAGVVRVVYGQVSLGRVSCRKRVPAQPGSSRRVRPSSACQRCSCRQNDERTETRCYTGRESSPPSVRPKEPSHIPPAMMSPVPDTSGLLGPAGAFCPKTALLCPIRHNPPRHLYTPPAASNDTGEYPPRTSG